MQAALSIEDVVDRARAIPCAPALLPRLIRAVQSSDTNADEIERLVQTDPALASAVLRIANSAFLARGRKCESLGEAILRLGSSTIYHLAATSVASRWLNQPVQGYGWEPGDLCRHSTSVAVAAEMLARRTALAAPETAYTAGLIHDVGRLALANANTQALDQVAQRVHDEGRNWRAVEREVLGYDSTDVSSALLQAWGFPETLTVVAALHPRPSDAPPEHAALVALIHAAKHLVVQLGYGVGAEGFASEVDGAALVAHGFTEDGLSAELPAIVERIQKFIEPDGRITIS